MCQSESYTTVLLCGDGSLGCVLAAMPHAHREMTEGSQMLSEL